MISNVEIVIITIIVIAVIMSVAYDSITYFKGKRLLHCGIFIVLFMSLVVAIVTTRDIPAIEVYRGNTTLEITYRDGIPVDSIVVYKKR